MLHRGTLVVVLMLASCGHDAAETVAVEPCRPCVSTTDCNGGQVCAQFADDTYCAPSCADGTACASDRACTGVTTYSGEDTQVCVPRANVCGVADTGVDTGSGPDASPSDTGSDTLVPDTRPTDAATDVATDTGVDAGPGKIGTLGGKVDKLLFAAVGDTRPPFIDDTKSYPTKTVTDIFQRVASLSPVPPLVVSTGDYMFARPSGPEAATQLDLYLGARAKYAGAYFPALGNHECTGATTSNCGPGTADGLTVNYQQFMAKMLGPIGKTNPWYSIRVDALDGSWTSKFVFVAPNAWTTAQQTWLEGAMSEPTTYTFVIRHEPSSANTAPGVTPSDAVLAKHPYTLLVVGHTHSYGRKGPREVLFGNGGAPLTGGSTYGFGLFQRRADGAIRVDAVDTTGKLDPTFGFAVKADGSAAP